MARLKVVDLSLSFGGIQALDNVAIEVYDGELLALIGPNGAGKTSLLNCTNGIYHPQKGRIFFDDQDITDKAPYKIAELGIVRTFQNLAVYSGLSCIDNLMAGRHCKMKENVVAGAIWVGPGLREELTQRRIVEDVIGFLEMEGIRDSMVGSLPYGLRKRVELGRALVMEPKLLLLDEPMAGMNVEEKEDMARFILDVHALQKIPIVLIEHDMGVVMDIAQRVIVLDFGVVIADGCPEEVKQNQAVIKAYLGEE